MKLPGFAWANQAAMDFQIPPEAGLHGIMEKPIAHFVPQMARDLVFDFLLRNGLRNRWVALGPASCEMILKASATALARVFFQNISYIRAANPPWFSHPCKSWQSVVKK